MAAEAPAQLGGPAEWGVCVSQRGGNWRPARRRPRPPNPAPRALSPSLAAPPAPLRVHAAMARAPTLALLLLGQLLARTEAQVSTGRRRAGLAPAAWGGGPGL